MRLQGLVYRAHHPRWSFAPHSGEGAARYGGRFNPPGMPALYTSRRMETAWLEAQQGLPFKAQPMTICAYQVDCEDIADVDDIGIARADLACAWEGIAAQGEEPPSGRVAKQLISQGYAGVVVPSFAPGAGSLDRNAVFWRWSDTLPYQVLVIDDELRLPRDGRSWEAGQ